MEISVESVFFISNSQLLNSKMFIFFLLYWKNIVKIANAHAAASLGYAKRRLKERSGEIICVDKTSKIGFKRILLSSLLSYLHCFFFIVAAAAALNNKKPNQLKLPNIILWHLINRIKIKWLSLNEWKFFYESQSFCWKEFSKIAKILFLADLAPRATHLHYMIVHKWKRNTILW